MNFIFLTYINRSGSTYLANLLDSSSRILACLEGDILVSFLLENPGGKFRFDDKTRSRLTNIFSTDLKLQYWGDSKSFFPALEKAENNLEAFFNILINYKNQVKPDAEFILFKAERIVYLVKKIQKVDIEHSIRFISIIRDPRAVFASQRRTCFPGTSKIMSDNPVKFADYWKRYVKISYSCKGENLLIIRFEDLIADLPASLIILSEFLKLDLSELSSEKGNLLKRMQDIHLRIHENILKRPMIQKIYEWQKELTLTEIFIIEKISLKYLSEAGYNTTKLIKPGFNIYLYIKFQTCTLLLKRFYKKIIFHLSR